MMFGNNAYGGQNNGNGINVNTTVKTLYSDYSSLTLGAWNQQLSIRLAPCTGTDSNGMRQYDPNRKASTALVPEKALMLKSGIDAVIMPNLKNILTGGSLTEPVSVGTSMGSAERRNIVTIELSNDEGGQASVFLKVHQMVHDDKTCDPQNIFVYKFGSNSLIYDYNPSTGQSREVNAQSEFLLFYDMLAHVSDLLPLSAHGAKYNAAVSARYQSGRNGQGNGMTPNMQFQRPSSQDAFNAPISNYDANDDLGLPFN